MKIFVNFSVCTSPLGGRGRNHRLRQRLHRKPTGSSTTSVRWSMTAAAQARWSPSIRARSCTCCTASRSARSRSPSSGAPNPRAHQLRSRYIIYAAGLRSRSNSEWSVTGLGGGLLTDIGGKSVMDFAGSSVVHPHRERSAGFVALLLLRQTGTRPDSTAARPGHLVGSFHSWIGGWFDSTGLRPRAPLPARQEHPDDRREFFTRMKIAA